MEMTFKHHGICTTAIRYIYYTDAIFLLETGNLVSIEYRSYDIDLKYKSFDVLSNEL